MKVKVLENLMKANDDFAAQVRAFREKRQLPMINLIGGPGCGKTTLLETTIRRLHETLHIAVIEGDQATPRDAQRIQETGARSIQINTGGGCHLNANQVLRALEELDLHGIDLVVVENVGNLVCPAELDLGEDAKVGAISVTEGGDKPLKYPLLFREARAVLLTKIDLRSYVDFDARQFYDDLRQLGATSSVFELSAKTGSGVDRWLEWIARCVAERRAGCVDRRSATRTSPDAQGLENVQIG